MKYYLCAVLGAAVLLMLLAWTHTAMDRRYGEAEPDWSFYGFIIGGWICKAFILLSLPVLLLALNKAGKISPRVWTYWSVTWIASAFLIVLGFAYFRDTLATLLNSGSFRMFPVSDDIPAARAHFIGREEWLLRWNRGEILAVEFAYVILLAFIIRISSWIIKGPGISAITATIACTITVSMWPNIFNLVNLDYDTFFGGIISDALFVDCVVIMLEGPFAPCDLTTQIASLIYLAFVTSVILSTAPILRHKIIEPISVTS